MVKGATEADEAGNGLMHFERTFNADRMSVNTPESSIF
jgi:hypothetical protein